MQVSMKTLLLDFVKKHPAAKVKGLAWLKLIEACSAQNHNELKETFNSADYVPKNHTVFNVGGNNYRIVAQVFYGIQKVNIQFVGTHSEYDKWSKDNRKK
jgi:mRNA interferase HigB